MAFQAQVLSVLIASPGDTLGERDAVEGAIRSWNRDNTSRRKVVLLPLRWEDASSRVGAGAAQTVLNKQLLERADIIVAVFYSRLGQPTQGAPSGTAEEIQEGINRGLHVHVYFSKMPLPEDLETDQLNALREFKDSLYEQGLIGSYASIEDLVTRVRSALDMDVDELAQVQPESPSQERRAVIRVSNEITGQAGYQRLVVENIGEAPADNVRLDIQPTGEGNAPDVLQRLEAERIHPHTDVGFPLAIAFGVAPTWRVTYRWEESGEEYEDFQTLNAF